MVRLVLFGNETGRGDVCHRDVSPIHSQHRRSLPSPWGRSFCPLPFVLVLTSEVISRVTSAK